MPICILSCCRTTVFFWNTCETISSQWNNLSFLYLKRNWTRGMPKINGPSKKYSCTLSTMKEFMLTGHYALQEMTRPNCRVLNKTTMPCIHEPMREAWKIFLKNMKPFAMLRLHCLTDCLKILFCGWERQTITKQRSGRWPTILRDTNCIIWTS